MKAHTQTFKENLTTLGKEITAKVTYTIDGVTTELDGDTLGSVTPHYEGSILKSVMKQVDIISDIDIPLNTEVNVQFGMRYNSNNYEYVDYGNYIVYSSEKQEDTNNYKIIAYDKMLYAMKDYEQFYTINLFDNTATPYKEDYYITAEGNEIATNEFSIYQLNIEPNTTYTLINGGGSYSPALCYYDEEDNYINGFFYNNIAQIVFTTPSNAKSIRFSVVTLPSSGRYDLDIFKIIVGDQAQDYKPFYPTTIKEYIGNLCSKIDLEFANSNEVFANYDKQITQELYSNLGYTYRDVLDDLAQVTASTICINKDDQLEIRYLNESINDSEEVEGSSISISDSENAKINGVVVEGDITQDSAILPSGYTQVDYITSDGDAYIDANLSLGTNFKVEVEFISNQITSTEQPIVSTWNSTNNYWNFFINTQGKADLYVKTHKIADTTDLTGKKSTATIIRSTNNWTLKTNGNILTFSDTTLTENSTNLKLFKRGDNVNKSYVSISKVKVWHSLNLVRYMIPCYRNSDNVIGMYDIRNKAFFTNAGSGAFTKGPNTTLPTPSSPIPINVVSGDNEINICGKNLANPSDIYDGYPTGSNGGTIGFNPSVNSITYRKCAYVVAGQPYTLSWKINTIKAAGSRDIKIVDNNNIILENFSYSNANNNRTRTFTPTYSGWVYAALDTNATEVQIEKGSATTYEPYYNKSYEVNLGKNIFNDYYSSTSVLTGVTRTKVDEGILLNGEYNKATNLDLWITDSNQSTTSNNMVLLKANTKYTATIKILSGSISNYTIGLYVSTRDINKDNFAWNRYQFSYANGEYKVSFTPTEDYYLGGIRFTANTSTNVIFNNAILGVQLEEGEQSSYTPYFEPIELCKIGTYQDKIFKSEGINVFDGIFRQGNRYTTGLSDTTRLFTTQNYFVKSGQTYTISTTLNISTYKYAINLSAIEWPIAGGTTYFYDSGWKQTSTFTFTPSQDGYLGVVVAKANGTDAITPSDITNYTWQVQEGSQATTYEPYRSKGKWLLHKEIGKVVLDGTNNIITSFYTGSTNTTRMIATIDEDIKVKDSYCNRLKYKAVWTLDEEGYYYDAITGNNPKTIVFRFNKSLVGTTMQTAQTYFGFNNLIFYYVKNIPTTTEITNEYVLKDLIALDKAKTYEGITNITSSFPIKFNYATEYETIDEDYIKNTRASFGEKYGPINSIVLSRSADSDNIYIQDEQSIEENGLCELKISDNQIMNSDNRNEYLDDLLDYLGGIEYYTNDYESIGITYLDLCDKYKVQIGDTKYDCIMFNDEVEIHDGLNEIIYTKKPEETQTDYKKATTTDKLKRQTSLIVDKQNERIEAIVGDVGDEFSSIRVDINGIKSQVQGYDVTIDELGNEIQTLRSSYTEQTPTMISDWFDTNLKAALDDLQNTANGNDEEIRKIKAYVRRGVITDTQSPYYNQAYIELGDETNQTTLRILQNRIQFLTNGQETAFISNNQLYINESTILTKEKVGHWVTTEDEDGLLNTYWED